MENEKQEENTELPSKETIRNNQLPNKQNVQNTKLQQGEGSKPFICNECGNSYERKRRLTAHMLKHAPSNQKTCICVPCGKIFKQESCFIKHNKRKHAGSEKFHCSYCKSSFQWRKQLEEHELIHAFTKGFSLKIAEQGQDYELQNHEENEYMMQQLELRNPSGDAFECSFCGKTFLEIAQLKTHQESAHQKGELPKFMISLSGVDGLAEDKTTDTAGNVGSGKEADIGMQQCDRCGNLILKSLLNDHLLSHADDEGDFKCVPCGKTFRFKTWIVKHNKNVHGLRWDGKDGFYLPKPEERTQREITRKRYKILEDGCEEAFVCKQCMESFSNISTLRQHMSTHTLLICDLCEIRGVKAKFATVDALEAHKLSHSNKSVQLKSEKVGFSIGMQKNGEGNVNKIEEQDRSIGFQIDKKTKECLFYCKVCDVPFHSSSSFKEHKKTHIFFQCEDCLYLSVTARFSTIEELEEHKLKHNRNPRSNMPELHGRAKNEGYSTKNNDGRVQNIDKKTCEQRFDSNQYKEPSASNTKMGALQDYRLEYDQCGETDVSKFSCKEPQNLQGTDVEYFHCNQCNLCFIRRAAFEEHIQLHADGDLQLQKKVQGQKFLFPSEKQVSYREVQNEEQVLNQNESEVQNKELQKEEEVWNFEPQKEYQEVDATIRRKERNWNLSVRSKEKYGNFSSKSK